MDPLDPSQEPMTAERPDGPDEESLGSARAAGILGAVRFAAETFLTSQTMGERIDEVLARLGRAADVSRVYVFENELAADGDLVTSQRFEWAAPEITPQIANPVMQRMSYARSGLEGWSRA
ncbi:MAG TPA: hypothetical protein VGD74_06545, partial [Vulgatibacter sp.]